MFCRSLFVPLYFFFWPLYCLFWLPLWYLQPFQIQKLASRWPRVTPLDVCLPLEKMCLLFDEYDTTQVLQLRINLMKTSCYAMNYGSCHFANPCTLKVAPSWNTSCSRGWFGVSRMHNTHIWMILVHDLKQCKDGWSWYKKLIQTYEWPRYSNNNTHMK